MIQIGTDGTGSVGTPGSELHGVAQQGEYPIMPEQAGQDSKSNITTADDQKFLHGAILPDSYFQGD